MGTSDERLCREECSLHAPLRVRFALRYASGGPCPLGPCPWSLRPAGPLPPLFETMRLAAKALAMTALDVLTEPTLLKRAKEAYGDERRAALP